MSRSVKADRPDSAISIVVYAEEFATYIYQITNNEKQFPKAMRYTLAGDLRNTATSLCKSIYKGCSKKPTSSRDIKKVRKHQDDAYDSLLDIKCMLVLATHVANPTNTLHIAELYDKLADAFNVWVKKVKRLEREILWKENATPDEKRFARMTAANKLAKAMPHDNDGFIILKKK